MLWNVEESELSATKRHNKPLKTSLVLQVSAGQVKETLKKRALTFIVIGRKIMKIFAKSFLLTLLWVTI